MSEVSEAMCELKAGKCEDDHGALSTLPMQAPGGEASELDHHGLLRTGSSSSTDLSPCEARGLLSLPWEMIIKITSHLPAHCVINVLPKVCQTLAHVAKDSTAWQLRARKIAGSRIFPVGPKQDFDWPAACEEMEQLISDWTRDVHRVDRRIPGREAPPQGAVGGPEAAADAPTDESENELEVVRERAQRAAHGLDETRELEVRQRNGRAEEERNPGMVADARQGLEARVHVPGCWLDPWNGPRRSPAQLMHQQPSGSRSSPPALEHMSFTTSHIARINSVLLLGRWGRVCATASRDGNVKLWDLEAGMFGMELHTLGVTCGLSTHQGWAWCLASQGPLLASGGFDRTVRLWNLQAGAEERSVIKCNGAVYCLSFLPDVLLVGSFDRRVTLYDPRADNAIIKSLDCHGSPVMSLDADDKYIVSAGMSHTVAVYDRRADKTLNKILLKSSLLSMSYSGSEVWGGDSSGMIQCFSMQSNGLEHLAEFDVGHTKQITGIHKSPGSLYTGSSDSTVMIHIPSDPPKTLCTLQHEDGVNKLSVKAGVVAIASGSRDVEVWRSRR